MNSRAAVLLFLVSSTSTACFGGDADQPVVFAAASLTSAFEEMGEELRRTRDVDVRFNFGASSDLARSIADGSPADIFASADERLMGPLTDEGLVDDVRTFATNDMAIAVRPGNPLQIDRLADLDEDVAVAVCAPEVPCGLYARQVFDRVAVDVEPRSFEPDVKAVLTRVALGEVDAGIVYGSDIVSSDGVSGVPIPDDVNVTARLVIAVAGPAPDDAAKAFYELVLSPRGAEILERHGFEIP